MSKRFSVGDIVRCIDNQGVSLVLRGHYKVQALSGNHWPMIINADGRLSDYLPGRFELVDDLPIAARLDPLDWLKTEIPKADEACNDAARECMTRMLRECFGIETRPKSVTTWTFVPVVSP